MQFIDLEMGDGITLRAESGTYLVSSMDNTEYRWPVEQEIFRKSYTETRPGIYIKSGKTYLTPLTAFTGGDKDQMVTVRTLEGDETIRAGDFYLARGVEGEIWPIPKGAVSYLQRFVFFLDDLI